jgi:hypothetical protein
MVEVGSHRSAAERKALLDTVFVGFVSHCSRTESAAAFRAFASQQVPPTGMTAHHFARGGNLEPLGHRLLGFDTFGASHKFNFFSKERAL